MKTKFCFAIILIPILIGMVSLKTYADSWVQKADFGSNPRGNSVAFSVGSKGYMGMGIDNSLNYCSDLWEYDPGSNTWTQKANFPTAGRACATAFAIGIKGYVGTGEYFDGFNTLFYNDFWEYDPVGNTWKKKANFSSVGREWAVGFAIGTKGYIGTGSNDAAYYNDFWEYDQGSNTWTQKSNFGGSVRTAAIGFAIGTKGYIGTGSGAVPYYKNDFWEYDQGTNTWSQKANFSTMARYSATGFAIGTKGYVGTGYYFDGLNGLHYNDFWEYDPASDTWIQKANFVGTGRFVATGFAIGPKGYIGTGDDGLNALNDFWEYTPDSTTGIEELNIANAFSIYPNPITSSSIIQLNTQLIPIESGAEVVIYDMVGKEMIRKKLTGDRMEIEKGSLVGGVYFVKVTVEGKQYVQKIVVE